MIEFYQLLEKLAVGFIKNRLNVIGDKYNIDLNIEENNTLNLYSVEKYKQYILYYITNEGNKKELLSRHLTELIEYIEEGTIEKDICFLKSKEGKDYIIGIGIPTDKLLEEIKKRII